VSGVVTEHGRVTAQSVVCAGGAWSTLFLGNLGVNLPQLTVRATVVRTGTAPDIFQGNASLGGVAIRRRQDGGYTVASSGTNEHYIGADSFRHFFRFLPALKSAASYLRLRFDGDLIERMLPTRRWGDSEISPFEKSRVLNPEPSLKAQAQMREVLARRLPSLAELPFEEAWAGMIDVTPDVVPVMDEVAGYPGLFLATGFSGHGFGIGPGAGRVMADMITGKPAAHDLSRFRLTRFSDGSPMRPGPGL
jgi:glycine/D-amino acid oxidase-like deaminating enzyme